VALVGRTRVVNGLDVAGPAIWISRGAPKLGWCWQRNPHTWLGMASAGARRACDV